MIDKVEERRDRSPVGHGSYVVKAGDCLRSIAFEHGFFWGTIWTLQENRELKEVRKDPSVLLPGDRVHIPDRRRRLESGQTEKRHRFRRKGVPESFTLTILAQDQPRANEAYRIEIDGQWRESETDDIGQLTEIIPPHARHGRLVLGEEEEEFEFDFGYVNPIDEISGVQDRLRNLGFYEGETTGELDEATETAILTFQRLEGLESTGEPDTATTRALSETHGS